MHSANLFISDNVPLGAGLSSSAAVEVAVPERALVGSTRVTVEDEGTVYVGVSIEQGRVELRTQREAFGYL